jgi:hypothetical protein
MEIRDMDAHAEGAEEDTIAVMTSLEEIHYLLY